MNLSALVDGGEPDDVLVHAGDRTVTRGELVELADAMAAQLRELGTAAGDRVAVSLPNEPETVATLFGVWRAGAVYVPLNPRLTDTERQRILDAVQPAVIVTEGPVLTPQTGTAAPSNPDVALIQLTSGTTGPPKPVPLEHSTVLRLIDGVVGSLRGGERSRAPMPNLVPVSLSVWAGIYQVLFAFRVGAPVVLMRAFDTAEFAALVRQFGIRSVVLPPAAMAMLADDATIESLEPLRYVRSITAPLSPFQARRFAARFGVSVLNGYGQTELGGEVIGWSAADAREHPEKLGAVGRPHAGVEAEIDDSTGELLVRTPGTGGASIRTGDIASIDADGFVWIEGRVSDMVNRGGLKVFPAEVEEVLRAHESIADAAVVGVADERLGEVPWAFVVLEGGATLDVAALELACREHLAPYKVPARFVAIDALPRNEVGKVIKHRLIP